MDKHIFKRVFDFIISLLALICLSPLLLVVTVWLHFANKGAGAFFCQEHPGKDAKDLIEKMEIFINLSQQQKEEMGQNAYNKVKMEFDREIVIRNYREVISEIIH